MVFEKVREIAIKNVEIFGLGLFGSDKFGMIVQVAFYD